MGGANLQLNQIPYEPHDRRERDHLEEEHYGRHWNASDISRRRECGRA